LLTWDATHDLLAAREYAAAGEFDEAERLLGKARGRATEPDARILYSSVEAEIALGRGDAARALVALQGLPEPLPPASAPELLLLRARAYFATGQTVPGMRALERRRDLLVSPDVRADNDRLLLDFLLLQPAPDAAATPGLTELERGWLELAELLTRARGAPTPSDPEAIARVRDWTGRYPGHPGTPFLPEELARGPGLAALPPGAAARIALLLPLSGKQQAAGVAVRDGAVGAWFTAETGPGRPKLAVYDTAALGASAAYERALAEGAQLVVGPLTREDVVALVAARQGLLPVPTLALNQLPTTGQETAPAFLFQFALDPEQEARAVARRILADGLVRGVALLPDSVWGQRVRDAFVTELQATGVVVLSAMQFYAPGAQDFSAPLRAALGRFGGAGERSNDKSKPLAPRDPLAERAAGPQFAFVAGTPQAMRAIKPQLRFQMTYDLPIYATSDAWEPSVRAAADMDGLVYPEMPWILFGGQGAPELWNALQGDWAAAGRGRLRLYAFGHDAYRLAAQLHGGSAVIGLDGLTGTLDLDSDGKVRRSLQFARVEGGRPQAAGASGSGIVPEPAANPGGTLPPQ
jgi:outer membrane PBP1 activator LpoA protein